MIRFAAVQLIRIVFILLMLVSVRLAWAGLPFYQGVWSFRQQDFGKAASFFEEARRRGDSRFQALSREAGSLGRLYRQTEKREDRLRAVSRFREMSARVPWQGRSLMQEALLENAGQRLTQKEWEKVRAKIREAEKRQPGSPWIAFESALLRLRNASYLTPEERTGALRDLASVVRDRPEDYHEAALSGLWSLYKNTRPLLAVTPSGYEGYRRLLDFLAAREEWSDWNRLYPRFAAMRDDYAGALCREGENLFKEGRYRASLHKFEEALWADPYAACGRLGRVFASFEAGSFNSDEAREVLESAMPSGGVPEIYRTYLARLMNEFPDPYLKGLYAYSQGHYPEAAARFEKAEKDSKRLRLYHADALLQAGREEDARALLLPALKEEMPDPLELAFVAKHFPEKKDEAGKKLGNLYTRVRPQESWWGQEAARPVIGKGERSGMLVVLSEGRSVLHLAARKKSASRPDGVLLIRLGGEVIRTFLVDEVRWRTFRLERTGPAGKYWLSAELHEASKAEIELGQVIVRPEENPAPAASGAAS